jgi:hypothetical protein
VGQKVIPRPSADYFVVGRRQKYVTVVSLLNLVSDFVKCNHSIELFFESETCLKRFDIKTIALIHYHIFVCCRAAHFRK